ncbi:ly6/PLAUR domain-containing protein 1 isoform 1-T1 [Acridotheres tristis]
MLRGKGKERFWHVLIVWFSLVFGFCLFWFVFLMLLLLPKGRLDGSNPVEQMVSLPLARAWNEMIYEVLSKIKHSMILNKSLSVPGSGLQIQCYQCEEFQLNNDCSSPEFIVNCTVNVQDMCQKEVMEKSFGIMYRKSCASSAACLIASAGYQSFCSPGKVNSVCISCCNTPLCNGPRPKKRGSSAVVPRAHVITTLLLLKFALLFWYC